MLKAYNLGFKEKQMNEQKRLARIGGVLYLLIAILGGFAEGIWNPGCMLPATQWRLL